jgi:hypothetical protein
VRTRSAVRDAATPFGAAGVLSRSRNGGLMHVAARIAAPLGVAACSSSASTDSEVPAPDTESSVSDSEDTLSDTAIGPPPEWVPMPVRVEFAGEDCYRRFDAMLPGEPWHRFARPDGCDAWIGATTDIYGNWWYFPLLCDDFPLIEDPLFGPEAAWSVGEIFSPACPGDPTFTWTYPEELLISESP